MSYTDRYAYRAIKSHYGNQTANRSGVPLMNHIDEGLYILDWIGSSNRVKDAFCLHPLFQGDLELSNTHGANILGRIDSPQAIMYVMEYRNIANQYLSHRKIDSIEEIALSPLQVINDMLVADKIQNYKDFLIYHDGTHPRSPELNQYFNNWLERLGIDYGVFEIMTKKIKENFANGYPHEG